jgi:radical SAM superfamily enzyme YgiQ (UPF0313 family)
MRILFVYTLFDIESPEKPLSQPESINFGLSYISSVLKQAGHETKLIILSRRLGAKNAELIDKTIAEFKPSLIGFSAVSTEYPFVAEQADYIKQKYPEIYLVIGGPHVSLNPDNILNDAFDALCISEGEYPILKLVEQLVQNKVPSGIANFWFKRECSIEKNQTRPFIENLDELPFPDRALWQEWIADNPEARFSVLLGRGCPFNCTYCSNHALRKLASGPYVRFRSPANIIKEIREIEKSFSSKKEIYLEVETFGVDKVWAKELFAELTKLNSELAEPIAYGANIRVTPGVDFSELFAACQEANFKFINIGLESGSDKVRRLALNRYYDNEDVIRTVKTARQYGLKVALFNMVGLPGETLEDFKQTILVNRECQPDWHMTSIFYPYPGTDLYDMCIEQGLIKAETKNTSMERVKSVLDLPGFSRRQIEKNFVWFDWYVYKGHKPWHKLLITVMATKLRTMPKIHYAFRRLTRNPWLKKIKKGLKI